jgi:hypothetical protein
MHPLGQVEGLGANEVILLENPPDGHRLANNEDAA